MLTAFLTYLLVYLFLAILLMSMVDLEALPLWVLRPIIVLLVPAYMACLTAVILMAGYPDKLEAYRAEWDYIREAWNGRF